jgi:sugar phosphate isomerase/epimerase
LNFEMDVFWIKQTGQDPLALLRKYPTRFKLMHLKDRKPGTPDSHNGQADVEVNVTLGQGDVGIEALVREARKLKLDYLFIEDESSRSLTQVPESLRFLKKIK